MHKFLTHDLRKNSEVTFRHDPAHGFLAIVDPGSYKFFAGKGLDWPRMLAHVGKQMAKQSVVAWGCPEESLSIRIRYTEDYIPVEKFRPYASAFLSWVRSDGILWFTSDRDLGFCAEYKGRKLGELLPSPKAYCPRKLLVHRGLFCVTVIRHFPWLEGQQDAPELNKGIHYTIVLRHYDPKVPLGPIPPKTYVPWT